MADMNERAKLIAATSTAAAAGFVLAAVLLPVAVPGPSPASATGSQTALGALLCSAASDEATPFYSEMTAAGMKMHAEMDVPRSGDIDRDFMRMMIPHHQGAIDMAKAELEHGDDPWAREMAQKVIDAQEAEIAQMKAWLAKVAP